MNNFKYILILSVLSFLWLNLHAEDEAKITMYPDCKTFYAGREHTLTIKAKKMIGKSLNWNLRYSGRTLASGQRQVPQNGEVEIKFNFPELNEGVIAETEFYCFIGKQEIKRNLYFFYANPFVAQNEALKKLKIGVWEPNEESALSELLKSLKVPYAKLSDLAGFDGKVLLVSGLDFDEFPGVSETLLKLVGNGKKVIILPPFSGTIPKFSEQVDEIRLAKSNIILELNKKFDSGSWNGKSLSSKSLKLSSLDGMASLEIVENTKAFTYCEISKGTGALIISTWDIVKGAKESPTPVNLLKKLIFKNTTNVSKAGSKGGL